MKPSQGLFWAGCVLGLAAGLSGIPACAGGFPVATAANEPDVDLADAKKRGESMLKSALWTTTWDMELGNGKLYDAGENILFDNSRSLRLVNKANGKLVWKRPESIFKGESNSPKIIAPPVGDKDPVMFVINNGLELVGVEKRDSRSKMKMENHIARGLITETQVFTSALDSIGLPGMGGSGQIIFHTLFVRAYDRTTGKTMWDYQLPEYTYGTRDLLYNEGVLFVMTFPWGGGGGERPNVARLIVINAADGKLIFESPMKSIPSSPILMNGEILYTTSTGEVVGVDAKTYKENWREQIREKGDPINSTNPDAPIMSAGDVFLVPVQVLTDRRDASNKNPRLAAYDARTHKQLWFLRSPEALARVIYCSAVFNGEVIVLFSSNAGGGLSVYLGVDLKTGRINWQLPAFRGTRDGGDYLAPPIVSNGILYLLREGQLVAIPLSKK